MDALGRVSGGVAHGVNNALATIAGVASVMLADPLLTAPGRRNLMAILDASGRAHTPGTVEKAASASPGVIREHGG